MVSPVPGILQSTSSVHPHDGPVTPRYCDEALTPVTRYYGSPHFTDERAKVGRNLVRDEVRGVRDD